MQAANVFDKPIKPTLSWKLIGSLPIWLKLSCLQVIIVTSIWSRTQVESNCRTKSLPCLIVVQAIYIFYPSLLGGKRSRRKSPPLKWSGPDLSLNCPGPATHIQTLSELTIADLHTKSVHCYTLLIVDEIKLTEQLKDMSHPPWDEYGIYIMKISCTRKLQWPK